MSLYAPMTSGSALASGVIETVRFPEWAVATATAVPDSEADAAGLVEVLIDAVWLFHVAVAV